MTGTPARWKAGAALGVLAAVAAVAAVAVNGVRPTEAIGPAIGESQATIGRAPITAANLPAGAMSSARAGQGEWLRGTIKTALNDDGDLDSYVYYFVYVIPDAGRRTFQLTSLYVIETVPKSDGHMWNKYCVGSKCQYLMAYLEPGEWSHVNLSYRVRSGTEVAVTVTNNFVDFTGYWGETWTGNLAIR